MHVRTVSFNVTRISWCDSIRRASSDKGYRPYTFKMHRAYLHHMSYFLTFENSITPPTRHTSDIQQLCAIYHMVI